MMTIEKVIEPGNASLRGYLHDPSDPAMRRGPRPCVIICPGGGYEYCSDREKDPPALALLAMGYQTFILDYAVEERAAGLLPLLQLSQAVMTVREHAQEWRVRTDAVAVMGFSAGGHLAGSLGTMWNSPELTVLQDTGNGKNRPNAMVLCYPVITAGEFAHRASFDRLTGHGSQAEQDRLSLETRVTEETPPAFLWHTADDAGVPVENTLLMVSAMRRLHIPFECHIFTSGVHGLSMANQEVGTENAACAPWFPLCVQWLNQLFDFKP